MPKIDTVKRITTDEFPEEGREVAERIGNIYNYFAEQVTNVINGNIDSENTGRPVITLTVLVDATGNPIQKIQFVNKTGLRGIDVIRAVNNVNRVNFVDSHPFISYVSQGDGTYTIENIKGLRANEEYTLVMELVY
jgi:hypothetical protein